jgi:large subunit ribosomal protein L29
MKPSEIRELSTEEVEINLDEAREELMRLRFQKATGELTDHNQMRNARVKIARLLTNISERARTETTEIEGEE